MIKKVFSILFYIGSGFFLLIAVVMFFALEDTSRLTAFGTFLLFAVFFGFIGYQISRIGKKNIRNESTPKPNKKEFNKNDTNTEVDYKRIYKNEDIGLFFMNFSEDMKKKRLSDVDDSCLLSDYYFMLGCACQGRIDEVEDLYKDFLESETNSRFIEHITLVKPSLIRLGKVAERIENSDMRDLRDNESVGEYANRKSLNSKVFMREYHYLRSFNYKDII